jgi:hypothetical protein
VVSAFTPVNKAATPQARYYHQSGPPGCSAKNTLIQNAKLTLFVGARRSAEKNGQV